MKKILALKKVLSLAFFIFTLPTFASHIAGGEIVYECLGNDQYRIKYIFYRDCSGIDLPTDLDIIIYDANDNQVQTLTLPLVNTSTLNSSPPTPCTILSQDVCIEVGEYEAITTLPPIPGGYQLTYEECCRNAGIVNGNAGSSAYLAVIPDISIAACNSNPQFTGWPPIFSCAGSTLDYDQSAIDADGDSIAYSLCTPIESAVPYIPYGFNSGYSASDPGGGSDPLTIDPQTGRLTGTVPNTGRYVIGICVEEYRNGNLISTTTRDLQLNVVDCQETTIAAGLNAATDCNSKEVSFFNTSTGADTYFWDLGDGTTSTLSDPIHNYTDYGSYSVTLIAYNATNPSCNDTITSLVATSDTCRPCGMEVDVTTTDGECNLVSGCYDVSYPCSGSVSTSSSCVNGVCSNILTCNGVTVDANTPGLTIIGPNPACSGGISAVNGVYSWTMNIQATQSGSANAIVTGGTPTYDIQWVTTPSQSGTSATEVEPGSYSVIVTDANGCTEVVPFAVNSTGSLDLTLVSSNDVSTCGANDGSASVSASGNTGTVSYEWQPGGFTGTSVTGLAPGTYTVTATDDECNASVTVVINDAANVIVDVNNSDVLCSDATNGTATATNASGGTAPYTYSWNTSPVQTGQSVNNLGYGFYTVTATDANGCEGTKSFTVNAPAALTTTMTSTYVDCAHHEDGTATVTASGGTPGYTYSWNTSPAQASATASNLPSKFYYAVVVTDANGCTVRDSVFVDGADHFDVDIFDLSTVSCAGVFTGAALAEGSGGQPDAGGNYTYTWDCSASTSNSITGLAPGFCMVQATDNVGCHAEATIQIVDQGPLTVTAVGTTACDGANDATATAQPVGGNTPYSYTWDCSGQTTQAVSQVGAGTCNVTVTDALGCTATSSVTINTTPAVSLDTIIDLGTCNTDDASIDLIVNGGIGPFVYSWSNGETIEDLSGLPADTMLTVAVWDANLCFDTLSVYIDSASCGLQLEVQATSDTICFGDTTLLTAIVGDGVAPFTYQWDNITTLVSPTSDITVAEPTVTTTYQVIAEDATGLQDTAIIEIVVNSNPLANDDTQTLCESSFGSGSTNNVDLTISEGTINGGTVSFGWFTDNALTSGIPSPSNATVNNGDIFYVLVTDDVTGCFDTAEVTYTVNTIPEVFDQTPADLCEDVYGGGTASPLDLTTLEASIDPNGNTLSWFSDANTNTPVPAANNVTVANGTIFYALVVDGNSCSDTATVIYNVNPKPTITAPTDFSVCEGDPATLNANNPDGAIISWDNTITDGIAFTPLATATYIVSADLLTCTNTDTVVVSVIVPPSYTFTSTDPTDCGVLDGTITLSGLLPNTLYDISNNAGTYTNITTDANGDLTITGLDHGTYDSWDVVQSGEVCNTTDNTPITLLDPNQVTVTAPADIDICSGETAILTATNPTGAVITWTNSVVDGISFSPTSTSEYIVSATSGNCVAQDTVMVNVTQTPAVTITSPDATYCFGDAIAPIAANTSGGTIQWYDGNGSPLSTGTTITPSNLEGSVQCFQADADNNGCISPLVGQVCVTINAVPALPTVSTSTGSTTFCQGDDVTLNTTASNNNWFDNPGLSTSLDATNTYSLQDVQPGTYTFYSQDDNGYCTNSSSITIDVVENGYLDVPDTINICQGSPLVIIADASHTVTWSDGTTGDTLVTTPVSSSIYTASIAGNCNTITKTIVVLVQPIPNVSAGADQTVPRGTYVEVEGTGASTYEWELISNTTGTNYLDCDICPSTGGYVLFTSLYVLYGYNDYGCPDTDTLLITIDGEISAYVPNIFSPNGDGQNDIFKVYGPNFYSFSMAIFNRWGEEIFSTEDNTEGWDGRWRGQDAGTGVYTYVVEGRAVTGQDVNFSGNVTLVR